MADATQERFERWKRWFIIRHIRYYWHLFRLMRWWKSLGQHYWLAPNEHDMLFLADVWSGKR